MSELTFAVAQKMLADAFAFCSEAWNGAEFDRNPARLQMGLRAAGAIMPFEAQIAPAWHHGDTRDGSSDMTRTVTV